MKTYKYVVNNVIQGERNSTIGLPQGLPSSPLAFNLAIADIDTCLKDGVKNIQFADDETIYCIGKNVKEIEEKLNATIENLVKYMSDLELEYSINKSKALLFSRKHRNLKLSIRIDGKTIQQVDDFSLLGVKLDRKLNLSQHIKNTAAIAGKAINVMRSVASTKWGVDPRCLDMLYKGCLRSKLEYCSFIYAQNKNIKALEKVQWRACRIISGCMQSTHTQSLEIITGIMPLRERFQQLTQNFLNSVFTHDHPLRGKIKELKRKKHRFLIR